MTVSYRDVIRIFMVILLSTALVTTIQTLVTGYADTPSQRTIVVSASGKAEVTSDKHEVSGYLHFYEEDGALAKAKADTAMTEIEVLISDVLGSYTLTDKAATFNNWGGEDCIKCGKRFSYTVERGFSVRCPDWETMVELQTKLKTAFPEHNFRANSLPTDDNQSIGEAVNSAIENAEKQAKAATGCDVTFVEAHVTESSIEPEVNYNFAKATVEVVFSF